MLLVRLIHKAGKVRQAAIDAPRRQWQLHGTADVDARCGECLLGAHTTVVLLRRE